MDNVPPAAANEPTGAPGAPKAPADPANVRWRASAEGELRQIDAALARLDTERAGLLARRTHLLAQLWQPAPGPARMTWGPRPAGQRPHASAGRETNPRTVQNLLLALGGVLLAVAVTAFTVVSWGHLGIGGRSAVLGVLTLGAIGVPALLLRRSLAATAEAVACLGLVLLALDAYALHRVALPHTDGAGYAAVASAMTAGVWAAYGLWLRGPGGGAAAGLRLPLPVAVVLAQLPLLLWSVSAGAGPFGTGSALLVTAAADLALASWSHAPGVRRTATATGAVTGGVGLLLAVRMSLAATGPGEAAQAAGLLLAAAAVGVDASWRPHSADTRIMVTAWPAAAGGLAAVAALGGMLRTGLPGQWAVLGYLLCGAAVLASARALAGRAAPATGLAAAAAAVHAAAVLWAAAGVATAVLGPLSWTGAVWSGAPEGAREAIGPGVSWPGTLAVPAVLAVAATMAAAVHQYAAAHPRRSVASCATVALCCATAVVLPVAADLPYAVGVALLVAQTSVLLVASATLDSAAVSLTALVCAVVVALSAVFWSLAEQTVTLGVLGALLVVFAAAAAAGGRVRQPVTACAAVVCAAALAVALCTAAGLPAPRTAFAVLAVAGAAALVASRLRALPAGLPVEGAGYTAALLALGLAAPDAPALATALALAGVIAAGTALRPDRRSAVYAAAALFVLATWVRLAASGVAVPEAYTLPVSVPALLIGLRRRRQDPPVSSWASYGPGLSVTLLPSLLAAWGDTHWLRPLLLGLAAFGVTLLGARRRLQAPLVLGGTTTALVALHELAPYIVQVVDALPRWLPPAVAGLLLLAVGATYEQRLHDARRVRDSVGRMG
ncbi:hypothetical protein ABZW18_28110 [Streptomyces sp. NPDC004647]|uniref:SCO7613 C-terminal domain-containing membrane protein n=1 Tax=Streptomyces sp. NPDC004647 TaxID=3154671 RepID=UPI0033A05363